MQIFLRGTEISTYDVEDGETIADVKQFISLNKNVEESELRLYSAGALLDDDMLLAHLTTDSVDINVGLKGGKVHGSLSRAGKVKGQTPKVEKKEKKKAVTGRAKRRKQYTRRFLQVVQTFGKKRGPNSNS